MSELKTVHHQNYTTIRGVFYEKLNISYQIFGKALHTAPIVIVNHALTGNSDIISEEKGWWKEIVGKGKLIDTNDYTVIAFNVLGNGYNGELINNYKDFICGDIAQLYYLSLQALKVKYVYAIIGGSLGGGIAWEMAARYPSYFDYVIPIAAHFYSSDWIIGHNSVQESILLNSATPLADARKMAMLFYRTPTSFTKKFNRTKTANNMLYNVVSWLNHHGEKLEKRFEVKAYLMMNHLLSTIDITTLSNTIEETLQQINATIIQIAIDSDIFFVKENNIETKKMLDKLSKVNSYYEIKSIHGHDAFLIEHEQINQFLAPVFKK